MDQEMLGWPNDELAERLLARGLLSGEDIEKARDMCREGGSPMAETLVSLNLLSKQAAYEELAGIYGVPFVDLKAYTCDPMVVSLIDEKTAALKSSDRILAVGSYQPYTIWPPHIQGANLLDIRHIIDDQQAAGVTQ